MKNKKIILTGDRPTGRLHIGHYFGSLQNRVRLSKMGVPTSILIADYQVLTDHDAFSEISQNTKQLVIDYLAAGIVPSDDVIIYPHSYVPECNQLMLPFLTLVSNAELSRNPTVKEVLDCGYTMEHFIRLCQNNINTEVLVQKAQESLNKMKEECNYG